MRNDEEKYEVISDENQLTRLINKIKRNQLFGKQFKFAERGLFLTLLNELEIDINEFSKNYFYIDHSRNLHIGESQFEYIWISTHGLIAKNKTTTNKAVNSCVNQYTVLSVLMEKAIEVSRKESVYDIDSHYFGYLSELSPALFHNILFYIEVFCKAYLSLNGIKIKNTHKLSLIYEKTVEAMKAKKHNNSLFQLRILDPLMKFVDHTNSIPGNFKEQFVKYDDNPDDDTVIIFETGRLQEVKSIFEISNDFILDYYYLGEDTFYLKPGVYERLIEKARTVKQKDKIKEMYKHLKDS